MTMSEPTRAQALALKALIVLRQAADEIGSLSGILDELLNQDVPAVVTGGVFDDREYVGHMLDRVEASLPPLVHWLAGVEGRTALAERLANAGLMEVDSGAQGDVAGTE